LLCISLPFMTFWEFHLCFMTKTLLKLNISIASLFPCNLLILYKFYFYRTKASHDKGYVWTRNLLPSFSNKKALIRKFFIKKMLRSFQILYETKTHKFCLRKVVKFQLCIRNDSLSKN
jgi:hypothetical protein